ncbi:hypothetical protein L249_2188 [Ophiocordyceps polyrhachis-furcata BCC 54312]|uniref:Uncharacterized protein n=1 Tax=Ophiocordyceps polyrhachis-furcata BCC 54312 TaxID=1330021 RepID=A0A367LR35_9HYPO|nr:hypothetical protein L249_2188 [Ophiocordyceps polyrhachis-furcata BCC 54312]
MRCRWRVGLAGGATGSAIAPRRRAFHQATALVSLERAPVRYKHLRWPEPDDWTTDEELPREYETEIWVGDKYESFVYLKPEVGTQLHSDIVRQRGSKDGIQVRSRKMGLKFYHDSRHFAHRSLSLPRLYLKSDLPMTPASHRGVTAATLWMTGEWWAITLNGGEDGTCVPL